MFGGGSGGSAAHMLAAQRAEAASASAKAEAADVHSGFIASARGWGAAQQDAAAEGATAERATPRGGGGDQAWRGNGSGDQRPEREPEPEPEPEPQPQPEPQPKQHQQPVPTAASRDSIVIHVHDDRVGQSSDFTCSRAEIVAHMKYFERFLGSSGADGCDPDDVDISVHCDISVFEWLVKYMRAPATSAATLAVPSVVSILISSEFLQMGPLVEDCLRYIHLHINQIVKLPIDFGCINATLLHRLTEKFSVDELDDIKDQREKLVGRLYMKKLELFLENEEPRTLQQCCNCKRLYTQHAGPARCTEAKMTIDYHGAVVARHKPNPEWRVSRYILRLRSEGKSWREIYWHIWGLSHVMTCTVCGEKFSCAELGHCSYHPQALKTSGGNEGVYPCCGQSVLNFDVSNKSAAARQGCCARNHVVRAEGADAEILDTMLKRHLLVTIPFDDARRLHDTDVDAVLGDSDSDSDDDASVRHDGARQASGGGSHFDTDVDEDSADSFLGDSDVDEDSDTDTVRGAQLRETLHAVAGAGGRESRPIPAHLSTLRRRQWQQDAQRETDAERMEELCEQLMGMRRLPRRASQAHKAAAGSGAAKEKRTVSRRTAKGRARRDGDRQGRQARPGSAQAFLAVRKQAQERAAKGGSGHWK